MNHDSLGLIPRLTKKKIVKLIVKLRLQKCLIKLCRKKYQVAWINSHWFMWIWGILTCWGNIFSITFNNDFSKYIHVYLLKNKSDAFEKFQKPCKEVENQFSWKIKRFRNDIGREYESIRFNSYVQSLGIIHKTTPI